MILRLEPSLVRYNAGALDRERLGSLFPNQDQPRSAQQTVNLRALCRTNGKSSADRGCEVSAACRQQY